LLAPRDIDIGDNMGIWGHARLPMGAFASPPLSTMRMTGENLGANFASLLLRAIAGEPAENLQELHPITFVDRDSHCRPIKVA